LYIATSLLVLLIWLNFPLLSIIFFFIVASFHFGHEDLELFITKNFCLNRLIYFFRGLLVISTPLYLNNQETANFIDILLLGIDTWNFNPEFFYYLFYLNLFILISLQILYLYLKLLNFRYFLIICIENLSIILIFNYLPLILAFTIYFCFMHSSKHILSLANELDANDLNQGLKRFLVLSLPLTMATFLIAVIMLFYLSNDFSISNAMLKIIFIGLASLTLPHIMLEYIYGRTKKR
jgi:beta-carotene 15,15'-dioxygenase